MKKFGRLWIVGVLYLAYTAIYVARLNLSAASVGLQEMGKLTASQYGLVAGAFSAVYACGRLLNGVLSDRIHPVIMLSVGLGLAGLSNLAFGVLPPFVLLLLLWALNAYGQSMLWSAVLKTIACMYEPQKAKTVASYVVTAVATGNVVGIVLSARLVSSLGVRYAFTIPGAVALICAVLVLVSVVRVKNERKATVESGSVFSLLHDKEVLKMAGPSFLHGVVKDNVGCYIFQFLALQYGSALNDSAIFAMLIPIMGLVGRLIFPLFYKWSGLREYRVTGIAYIAGAAVTVPLLFYTNRTTAALCLGLVYAAMSVVNTGVISVFPFRFASKGTVASVSGVMDFAAYIGCSVGSVVFGFLIERVGFEPMFVIWIASCILSVAALYFMQKNDAQAERR